MSTIRSLCVYCGAGDGVNAVYRREATRLGTCLANWGVRLVFGGGSVGLMGLVADAALLSGGEVVGIIPQHLKDRELQHPNLTELLVVDSMHSRKRAMVDRSDGFVILPGGLGTLDETFEILTWKQLGLHDKPIVIVDVAGYWSPLIGLIDHVIETNFAKPAMRDAFRVVTEVDAVLDAAASQAWPPHTAETDLM